MKKILFIEDDFEDFSKIYKILDNHYSDVVIYPSNREEFDELRKNILNLYSTDQKTNEKAILFIKNIKIDSYSGIILDYELSERWNFINGLEIYKKIICKNSVKALILTKYYGEPFEKIENNIKELSLDHLIIAKQKGKIEDLPSAQKDTYIKHIDSHFFSVKNEAAFKCSSNKNILIVTTTHIEAKIVREKIFGVDVMPNNFIVGNSPVFELGTLGNSNLFLVKSTEMGSNKAGGSALTISDILNDKTKITFEYVVMLGIAFGLKKDSQNIGNILVSRELESYDSFKITDEGKIHRGQRIPAGLKLLSRFDSASTIYSQTPVNIGLIISGEVLADNKSFVTELKKEYSDAIGAEMEGVGLQSSSYRNLTEWILIKGICDWGFDKQNATKDEDQKLAISNACDFFKFTIEKFDF